MIMIFGTWLCKRMISPGILVFCATRGSGVGGGGRGEGGGKGKNSPKWKIRITSVTHLSQEQYSIWSWFLIQLCEMMTSPSRCFSHFFKILIFRVVRRVKGQKMTHNYQFQSVKLSEKLHVIKIFGTLL